MKSMKSSELFCGMLCPYAWLGMIASAAKVKIAYPTHPLDVLFIDYNVQTSSRIIQQGEASHTQ